MWLNIDEAKTSIVCDGPCFLDKVIIGGGTAGAITLYNNPDGVAVDEDKILVIAPDQGSEDVLRPFDFKVHLDKGLTVVTAAATDILVIAYTRAQDGELPSVM